MLLIWWTLCSAFHLRLGIFNTHLINLFLFFSITKWCNNWDHGASQAHWCLLLQELSSVSCADNLDGNLPLQLLGGQWTLLWWVVKFDHFVSCFSLCAIGMFWYDWCYVLPRTPFIHDMTKKAWNTRTPIICGTCQILFKTIKSCQIFWPQAYYRPYLVILSYWCQLQRTSRVRN